MRRSLKERRGFGWTWEFKPMPDEDWHLCRFVSHSREALENDEFGKPSDDARAVRVELVPTSKRARKRYGY